MTMDAPTVRPFTSRQYTAKAPPKPSSHQRRARWRVAHELMAHRHMLLPAMLALLLRAATATTGCDGSVNIPQECLFEDNTLSYCECNLCQTYKATEVYGGTPSQGPGISTSYMLPGVQSNHSLCLYHWTFFKVPTRSRLGLARTVQQVSVQPGVRANPNPDHLTRCRRAVPGTTAWTSRKAWQRGQNAPLAALQLGPCAASGRAWRPWAARHSQG